MKIVCQQTILMKYYALFVIYEKAENNVMSHYAAFHLGLRCLPF